jgi:hypothetical protein
LFFSCINKIQEENNMFHKLSKCPLQYWQSITYILNNINPWWDKQKCLQTNQRIEHSIK